MGAGIGAAFHTFGGISDLGIGQGYSTDRSQTNFAWAVMGGLAFNVTPNLKIDLGYRYVDMGRLTSNPIACTQLSGCFFETQSYHSASHDVRLGFRYAFGGAPAYMPAPGPLVSKYESLTTERDQAARGPWPAPFSFALAENIGIAGQMSPRRPHAADAEASPPSGNTPELSVSELANALKRTVEDRFGLVRVRGEISNYRGPHSSGHAYFSLKDANARLDAVIWKGVFARVRTKPEEGMEVIATGKLTTFPGKSSYQIVIEFDRAGGGRRAHGAARRTAQATRRRGPVRCRT